jgi:hypothetical protein
MSLRLLKPPSRAISSALRGSPVLGPNNGGGGDGGCEAKSRLTASRTRMFGFCQQIEHGIDLLETSVPVTLDDDAAE